MSFHEFVRHQRYVLVMPLLVPLHFQIFSRIYLQCISHHLPIFLEFLRPRDGLLLLLDSVGI